MLLKNSRYKKFRATCTKKKTWNAMNGTIPSVARRHTSVAAVEHFAVEKKKNERHWQSEILKTNTRTVNTVRGQQIEYWKMFLEQSFSEEVTAERDKLCIAGMSLKWWRFQVWWPKYGSSSIQKERFFQLIRACFERMRLAHLKLWKTATIVDF